ncbi:MAG: peroxiredoxin [Planctomycetota bacterium]|nr:peroxiredoxin [Planctomycetota bacterium]
MGFIQPGEAAPDFRLQDQHGKTHALRDFRGRAVVMYFYPEDDTPLCTGQACQFRDHHQDFAHIKTAVLGVSPQDVASKRAFADRHALAFPLLADVPGADGVPPTSAAYGAYGEKNMYGRIVRAMLRTTYLIAPDGTVAKRWDRVKTPGHAAAVLRAATALHAGELLATRTPKPPKKAPRPRQKTRTQGGHPGYSGVQTSKGKRTPVRSAASRAKAPARTRGKRGA